MKNKHFYIFAAIFFTLAIFVSFSQAIMQIAPPVISANTKNDFSVNEFTERLKKTLNTKSIQDALLLFSEIPESFKNDYSLNYMQASLLLSAGKLKEADEFAQKILKENPQDLRVLFLNSYIAKAKGETSRKTSLLQQIIKIDPSNAEANAELGSEQMLKRNWQSAKTFFLKSLSADQKNQVSLFGYAQACYYTGDFQTAKTMLQKLITFYPQDPMGYAYLGKIEAETEKYDEAIFYAKKAIELSPDYYNFWIDYADYLRFKYDFKEAITALTKAAELNPAYFLTYVYRASLYEHFKEYDKALNDYKMIVKYKPDYIFAYESIGLYAWHAKKWTESRTAFEIAYKYNPKNISYPLMISACYQKEKKNNESQNFLTNAMRNMDKNSIDYAVLRLYFDKIGDGTVLQKVQSTESRSKRGKLLFYMGLYYQLTDKNVTAAAIYTDVISMNSPMFFEYRICEWELEAMGMKGN